MSRAPGVTKRKADAEILVGKGTTKKPRGPKSNMADIVNQPPARMNADSNHTSETLPSSYGAIIQLLSNLNDKMDGMKQDMIDREERILAKMDTKLEESRVQVKADITKMKIQLKSFIQKYREISDHSDAIREERDEILGSLADWFSTQGLEREFTTLSFDEDTENENDKSLRESLISSKVGFEKLKRLKQEIDGTKARGGNFRDLEREKNKLEKNVISQFKNFQKQKQESVVSEESGADDAWKHAAGEICELLKKVRVKATGDVEVLHQELERLLKHVEQQVHVVARLKAQIKEKDAIASSYADENMLLTKDITDLTAKLTRLKTEYKKMRMTQQQQKYQVAPQSPQDDSDTVAIEQDGDDDDDTTNARSTSLISTGGDSTVLKAKLKDFQRQLDHMKKERLELDQELHDTKGKLAESEIVVDTLEHAKKDLLQQLMAASKPSTTIRFSERVEGSHVSLHSKPSTHMCAKCHVVVKQREASMHATKRITVTPSPSKSDSPPVRIPTPVSSDAPESISLQCDQYREQLQAMQANVERLEAELGLARSDHRSDNLETRAPYPTPVATAEARVKMVTTGMQTECIMTNLEMEMKQTKMQHPGEMSKHIDKSAPVSKEEIKTSAEKNLVSLQLVESSHHIIAGHGVKSRGVQTDPASDPLGAWGGGVQRTISTLNYYPPVPPANWVKFDPTHPISKQPQRSLANAMLQGVEPDEVQRDVQLSASSLERELNRMTSGIKGFLQYTLEIIQSQVCAMATSNNKLRSHIATKKQHLLGDSGCLSEQWVNKLKEEVAMGGGAAIDILTNIQRIFSSALSEQHSTYASIFNVSQKERFSVGPKRSRSHGSLEVNEDSNSLRAESIQETNRSSTIPVRVRSSQSAGLTIEHAGSHTDTMVGPRAQMKVPTAQLPKSGDIKLTSVNMDAGSLFLGSPDKAKRKFKPAPLSHKKLQQRQKMLLEKSELTGRPSVNPPKAQTGTTQPKIKPQTGTTQPRTYDIDDPEQVHWSDLPEEYFQKFKFGEWQKTIFDISDDMASHKTYGDLVERQISNTALHSPPSELAEQRNLPPIDGAQSTTKALRS